jgi:hypothetical protein
MSEVSKLFGQIVIDTKAIEESIKLLKDLGVSLEHVNKTTSGLGNSSGKALLKLQEAIKNVGQESDKMTSSTDSSADALQRYENAMSKANNRVQNYIASAKRLATTEEERNRLVERGRQILRDYDDSIRGTAVAGLEFATANTQLASSLGEVTRRGKALTLSTEENLKMSVATIRSVGQLEVSYEKLLGKLNDSTLSTGKKIEIQEQLNKSYQKAKEDLQKYGTGNAQAAKAQVDFRRSAASLTVEVEKANTAFRNEQINGWTAQIRDLNGSVRLALGPLSGIASRIDALSGLFSRNAVQIASVFAAFTAYTVTLANAGSASVETERQLLSLQARIETLGLSTQVTAKDFDEMAHRLAAATLTSAADVREAIGELMEFGNVGVQSFEDVLTAAQGLQATFGGSLAQSASRLGRLLDDPIKNFESLEKRGVKFNAVEREKITLLQRSGNLFEAQNIVMEKFAGYQAKAGAEAQGLAGALDTISGNIDKLYQNLFLGSGAADEAAKQFNEFAKSIEDFTNSDAAKALGDSFLVAVRLLGNAINGLSNSMNVLVSIAGGLFASAMVKATLATGAFIISGVKAAIVFKNNTRALIAKSLAARQAGQSMLGAAVAAQGLRAALMGPVTILITLAATLGGAAYAFNKFNAATEDASWRFEADMQRVSKTVSDFNKATGAVKTNILNKAIEDNNKAVEANAKAFQDLLAARKALDNFQPSYDGYADVLQQQRLKKAAEDAELALKATGQAVTDTGAAVAALGKQVTDNTLGAGLARGFDPEGLKDSLKTLGDALDNESRALAEANKNLQVLREGLKNVNHEIKNRPDDESLIQMKADLERLLPLQEAHIKYLNETSASARQAAKEQAYVGKVTADFRDLTAQVQLYANAQAGVVGEKSLADALFASDQQKQIQAYKNEILELVRGSKNAKEILEQLAVVTGATGATAEEIAVAIAKQNDELRTQQEVYKQRQALFELEKSRLSDLDAITVKYNEQRAALTLLSAEEQKRANAIIAANQAEEQAKVLKNVAQTANMGTISQAEQLRLDFEAREQVLADALGRESELYKQYFESLKQSYKDQAFLQDLSRNLDSANNIIGGAMETMQSLGRDNAKAYQVLAVAQMAVQQAQAIASVWADPSAGTYEKIALSVMAGLKVGAAIKAAKSQSFNTGGYVSGAGGPTSDSIPSWLSNGEYVLKAEAVKRLGIKNLDALNEGKMSGFSMGGVVGVMATGNSNSGSGGVNIIINDMRSANSAPVETEETVDANGMRQIKVTIRDTISELVNTGALDSVMGRNYGVSRQGIRR